MLPTENLFFLGSICLFTVQAQVQSDVNCELFPSNPLCSLSQIKRLSVLDHPLPPPDKPPEWRPNNGGLDFGTNELPPPPPPPPRPNFRPNNLTPRPHRVPIVPRPRRPNDAKPAGSNRQKRFFFWVNPADVLQAKMNLWKTKLQPFLGESPPPPPPPARRPIILPYDEYDCLHGKLVQVKPQDNAGYYSHNNMKHQYQLANGQAVILASPIVLQPKDHQLRTSQTKHVRSKKKSKPTKYEVEMEEESEESSEASRYIRDHAPPDSEDESDNSEDLSSEKRWRKEKKKKKDKDKDKDKDKIKSEFEISPNGERIEFQVQGHNGPKTYIFGFDTGEGKSRQYRLEEREKDGTVKGQYGYYDAKGKLRTIKYTARPMEGYQEKHHEVNLSDLS